MAKNWLKGFAIGSGITALLAGAACLFFGKKNEEVEEDSNETEGTVYEVEGEVVNSDEN
jgi:hypothetical protein